jgi:hypothetical protein
VDSLPGSGNCSIADKEISRRGGQSETSDAGNIRSGARHIVYTVKSRYNDVDFVPFS